MANTSYAEIWASMQNMEAAHVASIKSQIENRLLGVGLRGAEEILNGAPVDFKVQAWAKWTANADVSGYHLKDILALSTTETAECVYPIVSKWAQTAKLSKYNADEILKMSKSLVVFEDFAAMLRNWSKSADLRRYSVVDVAELMHDVVDEDAAVIIGTRWFEQCGPRAVRELNNLSDKGKNKINSLNLPKAAIEVWNAAFK